MKRFIPYNKLSKKEQKKLNLLKRNDWNGINPSTKVAETDRKKYKRKQKHPINFFEDNK